jgi:hypothetical protein
VSIVVEARKGYRAGLEAMRDKLAADMDAALPAVVAQIAGRLQDVLKELAELSRGEEVTLTDVLAERRAARVTAAKPQTSAKSRRKMGGG